MTEIILTRQQPKVITDADRDAVRRVLFGEIDGIGEAGRKQWRRFMNGLLKLEPGEIVRIITQRERSGPYHRRHFKIVATLFESQERFDILEQFVYWLKVGAGWVTWAAGPTGGVVPIPKSISYRAADQDEFMRYHDQVVAFLRGPHAANYLWRHLKGDRAADMMNSILEGFEE